MGVSCFGRGITVQYPEFTRGIDEILKPFTVALIIFYDGNRYQFTHFKQQGTE